MTSLTALAGLWPYDYTGRMSKNSSNPDHVGPSLKRLRDVIVGRQPETERLNPVLGYLGRKGRGGFVFTVGRIAEDRIGPK